MALEAGVRPKGFLSSLGHGGTEQGAKRRALLRRLKCRALHLVCNGLRVPRSPRSSGEHPGILPPDPGALELSCPGGPSAARRENPGR